MKSILAIIILAGCYYSTNAQIFAQKLRQDQLSGLDCFLVNMNGDTLNGVLGAVTMNGSGITKFALKREQEKLKIAAETIKSLVVFPDNFTVFEDVALLPAVKSIKNEDFMAVLPKDNRVIYETIQLPGRSERFLMAQLLNPGFDNKLKIYAHHNAESSGETTIDGVAISGMNDDRHFASIEGQRPILVENWGYRKKALETLFNNCSELKDLKLKWKDFASHVFIFDQNCD